MPEGPLWGLAKQRAGHSVTHSADGVWYVWLASSQLTQVRRLFSIIWADFIQSIEWPSGQSWGFHQSILKEINPEYSLGLMLKLKLQYFGHLMRRTDSLEKALMLGKIEGGRRRGWQRMRWLMASSILSSVPLENGTLLIPFKVHQKYSAKHKFKSQNSLPFSPQLIFKREKWLLSIE